MSWLWPRLLTALLSLLGASLLGWLVGYLTSGTPWRAALAGAALVSVALVLVDALRAHRLMQWLRGAQEGPAPRGRRFWGEVGYRVERALRQRERALEQERVRLAQFLSAIEASPNGVMLLDSRDQIEWCNSVAADHLGLDPVRDLRQRVTNLVRAPAFVAHMQGGQFGETLIIPSPRGDASLSMLVRPYGEGMKLVLTQDITERERNDAMRRDFVANVSHEIRTPLTVLAGFVETMAGLPLTDAERQRVLVLMQQQTDRMQSLVADLLTLAQLEGSPRPPPDHWVPVASVLQRVETDALALSAGRHVLQFRIEESQVELAGNEAEIFSAIANLVNNAVRYTPPGGRVDTVWRARAGGGGELEVRDSGIGIAKEHLPRLTERFYRVDGSRSRDTGGTGLGLSIVKHVVQRHGGELDVHSDVGKGSSFRLIFPAARVRREPQVAELAAG
jgi:two-component system, OmpR family, phosphate regulon sensor histidine kinase PhoR